MIQGLLILNIPDYDPKNWHGTLFVIAIQKGGAVLTEYYNGGGWVSDGLSSMVGMPTVALCMLGLDCSVHMGMLKASMLGRYSSLTNTFGYS